MELAHRWKAATGYEKDRLGTELLDSLKGIIGQVLNQYRGASVPLRTVEMEARRLALEAANDWNDQAGMKLTSFVSTRLRQRLFRYVTEHQNVAHIPEAQVRLISPYNKAMDHLSDKFGREPSTHELADHLGVPVSRVVSLRKMLRPVSFASGDDTMDAYVHDAGHERAMLGYYGLTDQEKVVFDYLLGAHGQTKKTPGDVAKLLKISPARVSAIKESIGRKLAPYLD